MLKEILREFKKEKFHQMEIGIYAKKWKAPKPVTSQEKI